MKRNNYLKYDYIKLILKDLVDKTFIEFVRMENNKDVFWKMYRCKIGYPYKTFIIQERFPLIVSVSAPTIFMNYVKSTYGINHPEARLIWRDYIEMVNDKGEEMKRKKLNLID